MKTGTQKIRGQATVETALGMLVFITVLMFGVYFGEISVMNMKVSEAANAALWDISSEKVHDYGGIMKSQDIASKAGLDGMLANTRYANFDGRTAANWPSVAANGGTFTGAFTRATGMRVQCQAGGPNYAAVIYPPLWLVFPDGDNGATCQAQADAQMIRVPTTLADGTWSLNQHKNSAAFNGMHMCASGRPNLGGGSCRNQGFASLFDDFGYTTQSETGNCGLMPYNVPCLGNFGYYSASMLVWLVNTFVPPGSQNSSDKNLVQSVWGVTPWWPWVEPFLGPTAFGMSSCQEGGDFLCQYWIQTEIWASDGIGWSWIWNTTPMTVPFFVHTLAYIQRDKCYLGRSCSNGGVQEGNWNP